MDSVVGVQGVKVNFPVQAGALARLFSRRAQWVHALDGVSLSIRRGEVYGLVGESGSGKTTLGRVIVRLLRPTAGRIYFEGKEITKLGERDLRPLRRRMQVVFQDPHAALNPAMTVGAAIGHPLVIHGLRRDEVEARPTVLEIMNEVGLSPEADIYGKYPTELSGGQKQRVVIARAMILNPSFIVADEPVAMLDMSVRARILELMMDLKAKHNLTYLFITHDLATAKFLCDRLAIMYLGRIVEEGDAKAIYRDPKHPYTQSLLAAIPVPDPTRRKPKVLPKGEVPDAINPPANCHFHPRCPAAVLGCGWEPRDFVQYLEERRTGLAGEALEQDMKLLGGFPKVHGERYVLRLKPVEGSAKEVEGYLTDILRRRQGPLFEAMGMAKVEDGSVRIDFLPEVPLREVVVDGCRVLCILHQPETPLAQRPRPPPPTPERV